MKPETDEEFVSIVALAATDPARRWVHTCCRRARDRADLFMRLRALKNTKRDIERMIARIEQELDREA